jgi:hypothetical protein
MSASQCPRLFEAEAMRDGRLTGTERMSFERQVALCAACSREMGGLQALAEALRASPRDKTDELHVRRERTRLIAAFDGALVSPERRSALRRLALPATAAVVIVGLLVLWRARSATPPPQVASAVIHPDGAAVWSERVEGNREKVVLERGSLWIHVEPSSGEGRLLVVLPDGELEDIGTTFTVSAENDHTTRVVVQEGRIALRLRDRPPRMIDAGETWVADVPAPVACATAAAPPELVPSGQPSSRSPPSAATVASATAPDPSADFRNAMDALDRGDNHVAATNFTVFLERHPRDRRAEDAAYLRVIAFQRSGDVDGMKKAAKEYLRRYPAGFRYAEVERLSL